MWKLTKFATGLAVGIGALAVELLCWVGHGGIRGLLVLGDVLSARRTLRGGTVHCPRGHSVETEGTWECDQCGYRYEGSCWQCASVECHAVSPYTSCPTCGLSVRNPYRLGRAA